MTESLVFLLFTGLGSDRSLGNPISDYGFIVISEVAMNYGLSGNDFD
jgi:hypothetical protein